LDKIRETSTDVISANMWNNLEMLAHFCEDELEFDYERNEFYDTDLDTAKFVIDMLYEEVKEIQKENPDSFMNNFVCTTKEIKTEDGRTEKIQAVGIIPEKTEVRKSKKQIFEEYEKDYLERMKSENTE